MLVIRFIVAMISVGLMVAGPGQVSGQDFPSKPIRFVTGAIGSGSDITARLIAQGITGPLGQSVIVDNRTGTTAAEFVSKAPPDGYSLLVLGNSVWNEPLLHRVPYDPVSDFSPIIVTEMSVNVLAVHPSMPAKSVRELIALAKARPEELNYGAGITGSSSHIAVELFKSMAGVNIVRISYKSMGAALIDLMSGQVQLTMGSAGTVVPHIKSGRVRGLAVTSAAPSALFPDLPTVAATVPGYVSVSLTCIFAPAKTPVAIINRLNQEIVRFLKTPDVKAKLFNLGAEPVGNLPEEVAATRKSEMSALAKLIKEAGIRAD